MVQVANSEGRTFAAPAVQTPQTPLPPGFVKAFRIKGDPPFLKEMATGHVWPFSEGMAMRGDFVIGVYNLEGTQYSPPSDHPDYQLFSTGSVSVVDEARSSARPRPPSRKAAPVTDVVDSMPG
jgi:hypothetical protein